MQIIPAQSNVSYVQWKASASHHVEVASAMLFLLMCPLGWAAQQPTNASGGSILHPSVNAFRHSFLFIYF